MVGGGIDDRRKPEGKENDHEQIEIDKEMRNDRGWQPRG